jgi:glutamine synthetase
VCTQQFFLVDRGYFLARPDLMFTGRTLLGARPPKGQELEDHYFGKMPSRVLAYLNEVEDNMGNLGIPIKTRHNEVAPAQFEVAPFFESASIALDHNLLVMDILRDVATKHGFACLLHEKPFQYINGSGKHNNYSLATNTGDNLLEPGRNPKADMRFMAFLSAIISAIDRHADLVRFFSHFFEIVMSCDTGVGFQFSNSAPWFFNPLSSCLCSRPSCHALG